MVMIDENKLTGILIADMPGYSNFGFGSLYYGFDSIDPARLSIEDRNFTKDRESALYLPGAVAGKLKVGRTTSYIVRHNSELMDDYHLITLGTNRDDASKMHDSLEKMLHDRTRESLAQEFRDDPEYATKAMPNMLTQRLLYSLFEKNYGVGPNIHSNRKT